MIPFLVQIVICETSEESAIFAPANNLRTDTRFKSSKAEKAVYSRIALLTFSTTKRAAVNHYVNNIIYIMDSQ